MFWPLILVVTVPQLKTALEELFSDRFGWPGILVVLRWCLLGLATFLQWIPNTSVLPEGLTTESAASSISSLTFNWFSNIVWKGWKQPLVHTDLPEINIDLSVAENSHKFVKSEANERKKYKNVSLWKILIKCFSKHYIYGVILFISRVGLVFTSPILLQYIIQYVEKDDEPQWRGYAYAVSLFLANAVSVFIDHHGLQQVVIAGMQMRNAAVTAVYRKSLRLSSTARQMFTTGEITNFMSVDAQRIIDSVPFSFFIIVAPIEIVVCLGFLYKIVGIAVFSGLGVLILVTPLNLWASKKGEELLDTQLKAKDKRIKLMSEILSGVKVLKLYAWERPFMASIKNIRSSEIGVLRYIAKLWALVNFTFASVPFLMTLATFFTYVYSSPDNHLTADVIFVSLSLFNLIRTPLTLFPLALMDTIKLFVSVRRMNEFLNAEELDEYSSDMQNNPEDIRNNGTMPKHAKNALEVENATFTWDDPDKPSLRELNTNIKKGELVAVVGLVGAGKSSFMSALLGEMKKLSGEVRMCGRRAYVSQQAWIQNLSVQGNILFGKPYDPELYEKVLSVCGLEPDLKLMSAGDKTEIGENGINLSGGQKQRVALARAVYQQAEVNMLDDPLAALDAHVGQAVFKEVIGPEGILKNTTRILVTHNVAVLKHVDRILVIREGSIAEEGTYQELIDRRGPFSEFLSQYAFEENVADSDELSEVSSVSGEIALSRSLEDRKSLNERFMKKRSISECLDLRGVKFEETGTIQQLRRRRLSSQVSDTKPSGTQNISVENNSRLTEDEEALTGEVKWSVYLKYIKAIGVSIFSFNFFMYFLCEGISSGSNYVLSRWSDDPDRDAEETRDIYMLIYGCMGIAQTIMFFFKELILFLACAAASKTIHENLLDKVMHSPMSFFDTNPIGRILNRFSSDIDTVDQTIPFQMDDLMNCVLEVAAILVIISYTTPWFILVLIPLSIIYVFLQKLYIASSRQIKRLDMISKSPIFSHFTESVTGASSIRAFQETDRFIHESEKLVTSNNQCLYLSLVSNRWLGIRLENLGNFVILAAGLMAVIERESLSPGLAGLSISYSLMVTETLNWLVRMICALETNCVSLERIFEYEERKEEANWESERDSHVAENWPARGKVDINDLTVSYREGLPPVLKSIKVNINAGEKIGVCGRTGAGKSSLGLVLFRVMEAEEGSVVIDGENIAQLGLQRLRSRLTIIPQDPVLFSSSLRFNLDPANIYSDNEIKRCLQLAGLSTQAEDLDSQVQERGENFSVGQRQLICLARALLRSSKLLLLDEATAAVDLETDDVVQKTIREQFSSCTVLTIAHRLNTIMDSDRVMVLDKGKVMEFDSPSALLKDQNSMFYSLAKESDLV